MVELVDTLVLEASAIVREGSSPFLGTTLRRFIMKQATFENVYNKEYTNSLISYSDLIRRLEQ